MRGVCDSTAGCDDVWWIPSNIAAAFVIPLEDYDSVLVDTAWSAGSTLRLHRVEAWRDRLIEESDAALAELLNEFPSADRQHLRQLARNAKEEKLKNKAPHAFRDLFRELRELMSEHHEEDES